MVSQMIDKAMNPTLNYKMLSQKQMDHGTDTKALQYHQMPHQHALPINKILKIIVDEVF